MSIERLNIQIWYHTKFYRSVVLAHEQARFGPDLSLDQILGTVYETKFGSDRKDLFWTK